jgi:hypothetical protein
MLLSAIVLKQVPLRQIIFLALLFILGASIYMVKPSKIIKERVEKIT